MKSLLIIASVVALAFASPVQRALVTPGVAGPAPAPVPGVVSPGVAGPAPAPEFVPIAVGPAILPFEPISVGPAIVDNVYEPISVGPAIVDNVYEPIAIGPAIIAPAPVATPETVSIPTGTPLVQIILNIQSASQVETSPAAVVPEIIPTPVQVVDQAFEPISVGPAIVENVVPEPVVIGSPSLPTPIVPEPVVIGSPSLPTPIVPEPVVIGTPIIPEPVVIGAPIIPAPAITLPETLN